MASIRLAGLTWLTPAGQAASNCGLIADDGERPVLATIESGLAAGRLKPRDVPDRQEHRHEMRGTGTDGPAPAPQSMRRDRHQMAEPLEVVCAADLAGKPIPPRQEHVEGMIPAGNVTLLYGDGGTGKSLLALQLAVATAAGSQWIGLPVARGSTLCRDAKAEGITKAGFLTAMNNLFAEGRIVNEVFGPPSKPRHRIALKRDNGDASD